MGPDGRMRAVQYSRYGDPSVLSVGDVGIPKVGASEVLVQVVGASVNASDLAARAGRMRGMNGFGFPKGTGADFSGTVVKLGRKVVDLCEGDKVWGYLGMKPPGRSAAAAEFVVVSRGNVSLAPKVTPLLESAALPLVGLVALQGLRDGLRVTKDHEVLIVGATGGVGSAAIQVAQALGATVDAVVGNGLGKMQHGVNLRSVFNYHQTEPSSVGIKYDAVFDASGGRASLREYRHLLKRRGRMAVLSPSSLSLVLSSILMPGPAVRLISAKAKSVDLEFLASMVDDGRLLPILAKLYKPYESGQAHLDAQTESSHGKRIISFAGVA